MNLVYDVKKDCCGCTACQEICPSKAIKMRTDGEGFYYPLIDHSLCTDCGACREVCPFTVSEQLKHQKRLSQSVEYPKIRQQFWNDMFTGGFAYVMDKYMK